MIVHVILRVDFILELHSIEELGLVLHFLLTYRRLLDVDDADLYDRNVRKLGLQHEDVAINLVKITVPVRFVR